MIHIVKELCAAHISKYPATQVVDLLKLLHHGEFGPGHLLTDSAKSKRFLAQEAADCPVVANFVEPIGFGFCRLHLSAMSKSAIGGGISLDTFHRLFELSALSQHGSAESFAQKVATLKHLCDNGTFAYDSSEIDDLLSDSPALFRHSPAFREAYSPAYRVVKAEYCRPIPLLAQIDAAISQNQHTIVAIDGGAASGKTTLGGILHLIYDCNILHMDHFFLQQHQRTPERLATPGGNIDHERFKKEALEPILAQIPFSYRPFDCQTWDFADKISISPNRLTIIEGCYSHHPALAGAYDIKVFLKIDQDEQMRRIALRNIPPLIERFRDIWIPMEQKYFDAFNIRQNSDVIF